MELYCIQFQVSFFTFNTFYLNNRFTLNINSRSLEYHIFYQLNNSVSTTEKLLNQFKFIFQVLLNY